jgi:hypothetical protein
MDDIEERAETQLKTIEKAYSIKIQNREEIARLIAGRVKDNRQVLMVCTSLNSWIAGNNISGDLEVPSNVVLRFIEAVLQRWKEN